MEKIMSFGTIEIHAGDFKHDKSSQFLSDAFLMKKPDKFLREKILPSEIETLEEANEENTVSIGGAAGWGLAGTVLLGPVGLLAGLVLGGKGKNVTFVCKFKDGRKFLGTTTAKTFNKIKKHVIANSF